MNLVNGNKKEHAVAVLVVSTAGIPLVKDPQKGPTLYWKAPGGRSRGDESAIDTAIREVDEEIGVTLTENDLDLICTKDLPSHIVFFYVGKVDSLTGLKARGEKGEIVRVFSLHEVLALKDFLRNHKDVFLKYLISKTS
jgi:ADP-ribose pyrophosphatase YjhB (NUDIX family)